MFLSANTAFMLIFYHICPTILEIIQKDVKNSPLCNDVVLTDDGNDDICICQRTF